jgi:acetyl esterase/lipase
MAVDRLFLGASALGALNTVNAYRPLARRGRGGLLAFMAGEPTSEAPLVTIAWQAAATSAFVAAGAGRTPAGKAALALNLASWAALAQLAVEARQASGILEAALEDALGAGYRAELPASSPPEVPLTVTQTALPRLGERKAFRATRNLAYGEHGRANHLDIWRSADLPRDAGAPVLLQVHGGAWVMGEKEVQGELLLTEMARRGWVGVSINYRLSPRSRWPDHLVDVKRAIAWVRANIADQGGSPAHVAVTGGSAGGHLTALAALTPNEPTYQPGFEDADTTVQAAVPFYGVYDVADLAASGRREILALWEERVLQRPYDPADPVWHEASPITRVGPHAPPMFLLHGRNDTLVPVEQARHFVDRLRATSVAPVAYAELPRAQHAFEVFRSTRSLLAVRAVARFLEVTHARASGVPTEQVRNAAS